MAEHTVRVHFIDDTETIVPAKNIRWVGEEGARRGMAIRDGKEVPIYNHPEDGTVWHEQLQAGDLYVLEVKAGRFIIRQFDGQTFVQLGGGHSEEDIKIMTAPMRLLGESEVHRRYYRPQPERR